MVNIEKALLKDAKTLLDLQKECFEKYSVKYGDFSSNPYHMTLHRMEFNLKYRFGTYYKIIDFVSDEVVGAIFIFELDDSSIMKIAQFYIKESYQHLGIGSKVLSSIMEKHSLVKTWFVDTILQEESNVSFYEKLGFEQIDYETEHDGLTFVTLSKKI